MTPLFSQITEHSWVAMGHYSRDQILGRVHNYLFIHFSPLANQLRVQLSEHLDDQLREDREPV